MVKYTSKYQSSISATSLDLQGETSPNKLLKTNQNKLRSSEPAVGFAGCQVVLEWLQQEYWSRQLGGGLNNDWDSASDGEEGEELQKQENELIGRQKEMETYSESGVVGGFSLVVRA